MLKNNIFVLLLFIIKENVSTFFSLDAIRVRGVRWVRLFIFIMFPASNLVHFIVALIVKNHFIFSHTLNSGNSLLKLVIVPPCSK